jgi:kynurenine formamidase
LTLVERLLRARVYDLGQPLEATTPVSPNHPPFRMGLVRRHGDLVREDGSSGANEMVVMGGHTGTHIDALCHVSLGGRLYGGVDALESSRGGRFRELGVETIAPIVRRGVLLDPPAAHGLEGWEAGRPITAADLQETCRRQGSEVRPGDAVLVRSGWPRDRWQDPAAFVGLRTGVPGPDESAAHWLAERRVFLTGADTIAYEWLAPGAGHRRLPVHVILLAQAGVHIVEVMHLEELSRDRVYEFAFVASPLRMVGATGSPLRPLAMVEQ